MSLPPIFTFFFFNDTATTEIYTLSLHDALPISRFIELLFGNTFHTPTKQEYAMFHAQADRKSTRLNSSHSQISYAVFCLKKKKKPSAAQRSTSTEDPATKEILRVKHHLHMQTSH